MFMVYILQCGNPFKADDIIPLNGAEEDVEALWSRMDERRLQAKLDKVGSTFNSSDCNGKHVVFNRSKGCLKYLIL